MTSCHKENITEPIVQDSVETRGAGDICNNLIENGDFEVTMTITDSNGCCTTKTTIVDCHDPICDYYVCWAWDGLSMQNVNRISGFT